MRKQQRLGDTSGEAPATGVSAAKSGQPDARGDGGHDGGEQHPAADGTVEAATVGAGATTVGACNLSNMEEGNMATGDQNAGGQEMEEGKMETDTPKRNDDEGQESGKMVAGNHQSGVAPGSSQQRRGG